MVVMLDFDVLIQFSQHRDWLHGNFIIVYLGTIILEMRTSKNLQQTSVDLELLEVTDHKRRYGESRLMLSLVNAA
jgi:hypothetical protein